jgi:hypothetical protein
VERTPVIFRKLLAAVGVLTLLGGCSVGTRSAGDASRSRPSWNVNGGRFVPAGVVSFASLSGTEICGLADQKFVSKEFGFDFSGFEPSYEIGARGARCGFDATSDGFEGDRLNVSWSVGPPEVLAEPSPSELLTRSQAIVDDFPVTVSVNGDLVEASMSLKDRLIRVETYSDSDTRRAQIAKHILVLLRAIHTRLGARRPRPQPVWNARVPDVFAFSPAQFCSLLRDRTVASLGESPLNLAAASPEAFDISLVRSDVLWCTKGRAKVELKVNAWITSSYDDQAIRGLPSSSSIGLSDADDPRSEQARLEVAAARVVDGGTEERVITLIAHGTAYNAESRAILQREMEHIIDELNRRLPQPLVYKLEDLSSLQPTSNTGLGVPTRVPLGFGEAQ